jgi:hypothetical protein
MKSLAIWLDTNQAFILNGKGEILESFDSGIVTREREAGQGNDQARMGSHVLDPGRKKEERYRHELHHYFREISDLLQGYSPLLIFGPGPIKKNLHNFLQEDKRFRNAEINVETADSMTENQLAAFVRTYFAGLNKF